jgi:hypothetical protein
MARSLVSSKLDSLILSTIVAAFEAYGSALVGITPPEPLSGGAEGAPATSTQAVRRG